MSGRAYNQSRDDLLRATVYDAFDKRGTEEFTAACRRALDGWVFFPLVEYLSALEEVNRLCEERQRVA